MKVKAKLSAFTLALALAGGALLGCNNGGGNPPAPVIKYFVSCSKDDAKYTVSAFAEEGYLPGSEVTFSVTQNDPDNFTVEGVESDEVNVTTVSALNYKFTMPEKDVALSVKTKAVDKWVLATTETDPKVNVEITFTLKFGTQSKVNFSIEGRDADETAKLTDAGLGKVTFHEAGDYALKVKFNDEYVIENYAFHVRDLEPGETEDDPISTVELVNKGHQLDLVSSSSNIPADKLTKYYWATGKVISEQAAVEEDRPNLTVTLEGGLVLYHVGCPASVNTEDILNSGVGSVLKIYGQVYNYGRSGDKADGTVQLYTGNTPKSQVKAIDNSQLSSIAISDELRGKPADVETLVAKVSPYNKQVIDWVVGDPSIATVNVPSTAKDSRTVEVTLGNEGTTTLKAVIGTVESNVCTITVSSKTQSFRPLAMSEIQAGVKYKLATMDDTGTIRYAKAEISGNYIAATASDSDAAQAELISLGDGKYNIKLDDKYVGLNPTEKTAGQPSGGYYNNPTMETEQENAYQFTYSAEKGRFEAVGKSSSSADNADLYFCYYNGSFRYSETPKHDGSPVAQFWGFADAVLPTALAMPSELTVIVNNTATLKVTPTPAYADLSTGVWHTEDETVATVVDGVVTGLKAGETDITFTCNEIVKTCHVTVSASGTIVEETFTIAAYCEALSPAPTSGTTKMPLGQAINIDSDSTFTITGSDQNTGKLYKGNTTGWAVRLYSSGNAKIVINVGSGCTLISASININLNKDSLYNAGTDVALTVEENSASYSVPNTSALYSISVKYSKAS